MKTIDKSLIKTNLVIFGGSNKPTFYDDLNKQLKYIGLHLDTEKFKIWHGGGNEGIMATIPTVFMKKGGFIGSVDWKKFVEKFANQSSLTDTESDENNFFHFEKQVEDTFHERQKKLIEKGDLYLCLPGGVGTLSEVLDVLVQNDTQGTKKIIVMFSFQGFFRDIELFLRNKEQEQFIKKELLDSIFFIDNANEILDFLNNDAYHRKSLRRAENR